MPMNANVSGITSYFTRVSCVFSTVVCWSGLVCAHLLPISCITKSTFSGTTMVEMVVLFTTQKSANSMKGAYSTPNWC